MRRIDVGRRAPTKPDPLQLSRNLRYAIRHPLSSTSARRGGRPDATTSCASGCSSSIPRGPGHTGSSRRGNSGRGEPASRGASWRRERLAGRAGRTWRKRKRTRVKPPWILPSGQRSEERLGLLEVGGVKALGEPAIDRCQQRAGVGLLALLLPQPSQAQRRPAAPGIWPPDAGPPPGPAGSRRLPGSTAGLGSCRSKVP